MARTQKNKATSYHLGLLKAKLAKLRRELITPSGGGGPKEEGLFVDFSELFSSSLEQDSTWPRPVMLESASLVRTCQLLSCIALTVAGFPSVGKSTLLTNLAGVYSEVAAYEFTTLTTVPGVIHYKGAKIQLLDLPGYACILSFSLALLCHFSLLFVPHCSDVRSIIEGAKDGKGRGRQVIAGMSLVLLLHVAYLLKWHARAT
jgi:ribosome-interacting GTPase 1